MFKLNSFFILTLFICFESLAQNKRANIWYFTEKAGLDFTNGNPIALSDGQIPFTGAGEGTATICDVNGNLLFYTDGMTVWNKQHIVMPNGTGLTGNNTSTQSAIIVPQPGNDSIYYIFTMGCCGDAWAEFNYSTVNINLQSGLGDVVLKNINLLSSVPRLPEKITAVHHCNGIDVWVITHDYTHEFHSFLVTSTGVASPVNSPLSGTGIGNLGGTVFNNNYAGQLKASPNGKMLANAWEEQNPTQASRITLYNFDNQTGMVSNPLTWNPPGQAPGYGISFSSNSSILYVSTPNSNGGLYQYDLNASNIPGSEVQIYSGMTYALQLAQNEKIYVAHSPNGGISVINSPNVLGTACDFSYGTVPFNGISMQLGFPDYIQSYFNTDSSGTIINGNGSFQTISFCKGDSISLSAQNGIAYQWSGASTDTVQTIMVSPDSTTFYYVTVTGQCALVTDTFELIPLDSLPWQLGNDSIICQNETITLGVTSVAGVNYQWSGGSSATTSKISITPNFTDFYALAINSSTCGNYSDTVIISTVSPISPDIGPDTSVCLGTSILLTASGGATSYQWNTSTNNTSQNITVMVTTTVSFPYICNAIYNECGMTSDTVNISGISINIDAGNDVAICSGDSIQLTATGGITYTWSPATGLNSSSGATVTTAPPSTITYTVTGTDNNCSDSDSITVTVNDLPLINAGNDVSICSGNNVTLNASGAGNGNYTWLPLTGLSSVNDSTVNASPITTITYTVTGTDMNNCTNTDEIIITVYNSAIAVFTADPTDGSLPLTVNFMNNSSNATIYQWILGDGDSSTIDNPVHVYTEEGEYPVMLIANNINDCPDTAIYTFIKVNALSNLWIPNSFTPNNDGTNDEFIVYTTGITKLEVNIYNRWGELIDQWNDLSGSWDGLYKGTLAESGVYVYVVKATGIDGIIYNRTGHVSVIR